ncbi:MAG: hypothetical protein IT337_12435 [Thermomicrobiales bacterium]|nr:hypothetical protein [Thermomicrobiales bacterium]
MDTEPDQIIEAVAMAIRDQAANRAVDAKRRPLGRPWKELPRRLRESYRAEARAAIRAYERAAR